MADDPNIADPNAGNANDGADKAGLLTALKAERGERQRLADQLNQQAGQIAELRGRQEAAAVTTKPVVAEKPRFTRAQLNAAVAENKISQAEADDYMTQQITEDVTKNVTTSVTATMQTTQRLTQINGTINRYAAAVPELGNNTSPQAQKVVRSFNRLVNEMGFDSNDPRTKLVALEGALGDITALEKTGTGAHETHEERAAGGGDGGGDESGVNQDGSPKGLTARQRAYYTKQIADGHIADWKAVGKELEYARPGVAARAQDRFGVRVAPQPSARGRARQRQAAA